MNKRFYDWSICIKENIYYANWKLSKNGHMLCIFSDEECTDFIGIVTKTDMEKAYLDENLTLETICNRNPKVIITKGVWQDDYSNARNIFNNYQHMQHIPVINEKRELVDIFSRRRVFWKRWFDQKVLPRMHYATPLYYAALEASMLNYNRISVIEFGVAGGAGLLITEFHAEEISKILNVKIDVYGFDTGEGLPTYNDGYKDMIHVWPSGAYSMDYDTLRDNLKNAKLVIGNIRETGPNFLKELQAPIACMLIDVDRYSSTKEIFEMLDVSDELFLPRIYTYFDDISSEYEFSGENIAIKEFNNEHDNIKIAPEGFGAYDDFRKKLKIIHRFKHKQYNEKNVVYNWHELYDSDYQLSMGKTVI